MVDFRNRQELYTPGYIYASPGLAAPDQAASRRTDLILSVYAFHYKLV